jgi:hypothetical protein
MSKPYVPTQRDKDILDIFAAKLKACKSRYDFLRVRQEWNDHLVKEIGEAPFRASIVTAMEHKPPNPYIDIIWGKDDAQG